jgi:regulator of protease activity HflC (stomatin/prohibitin superfamily)
MYQRFNIDENKDIFNLSLFILVILLLLGLCAGLWLGLAPVYRVWSAEKEGEAQYAQAEQNRRITILEADAKLASASALAKAEVERARGVAEANRIIGDSLKENEGYLRWLWIENLDKGGNSVIYIPTEAGLPILEAGKR